METSDQEQASYDVQAVQQKWRQVWDGLDSFRAGSAALRRTVSRPRSATR